jgi:ribulokinase
VRGSAARGGAGPVSFLLGADFGTGGAKVALISDAGEQLGYAFEEYPIHTDGPGWSEHDAPRYWEAFCRLTRAVLAESRVAPAGIRGIAVSSALPSVVFIEADGTPLPRAYNLMDRRATAEVTWLKEHVGAERIFSVTANRLEDHPRSSTSSGSATIARSSSVASPRS